MIRVLLNGEKPFPQMASNNVLPAACAFAVPLRWFFFKEIRSEAERSQKRYDFEFFWHANPWRRSAPFCGPSLTRPRDLINLCSSIMQFYSSSGLHCDLSQASTRLQLKLLLAYLAEMWNVFEINDCCLWKGKLVWNTNCNKQSVYSERAFDGKDRVLRLQSRGNVRQS